MPVDCSTHPVVVQYAAGEMMKGKSPSAAAKAVARKFSGGSNLFISPVDPMHIDPAVLEDALFERMVDFVVDGPKSYKSGKEHYALNGTLQHYEQAGKFRPELKRRAIERLGYDPFPNDDNRPAQLLPRVKSRRR